MSLPFLPDRMISLPYSILVIVETKKKKKKNKHILYRSKSNDLFECGRAFGRGHHIHIQTNSITA